MKGALDSISADKNTNCVLGRHANLNRDNSVPLNLNTLERSPARGLHQPESPELLFDFIPLSSFRPSIHEKIEGAPIFSSKKEATFVPKIVAPPSRRPGTPRHPLLFHPAAGKRRPSGCGFCQNTGSVTRAVKTAFGTDPGRQDTTGKKQFWNKPEKLIT